MNKIQAKIINLAQRKPGFNRSDLYQDLDQKYTKGYLSQQLTKLVKKNKLSRLGAGKYVTYALPQDSIDVETIWQRRFENIDLADDIPLHKVKEETSFFTDINENIVSIFDYAFSEMTNNAIDHSKSNYIKTTVLRENQVLHFIVHDYGIGVFKNIQEKFNLSSELEAIQELIKGKNTTAPEKHSGEGIFFTSKAADIYELSSYSYRLRIDNVVDDIFIEEVSSNIKGTKVDFQISLNSQRHLIDIFEKYQTNPSSYDFDKTKIDVKLYTLSSIFISRSQAKRVLQNLEKFSHVVFDFNQVPTVGQAFADEIFRVFANQHSNIKLEVKNMNQTVEFMIKRVNSPNNVKLT